ncbi:MAG: hypothetical protein EB053_05435 [Chlamydiae bacterium]|nr:hypothetical protein [Chlamydiota bacterium]
MSYDFEKRLKEFQTKDIQDLESMRLLFREAVEFLKEFKIVEARGTFEQRQRMEFLASKLKEVLLEQADRIETTLGMNDVEIQDFLGNEPLLDQEGILFIEEASKELIRLGSIPLKERVSPPPKGAKKIKNWIRP